jgi:hypothetical protein
MKLITVTIILLATLTFTAKEKYSECIKELNKCRNTCYAEGIKPDGECILRCYRDADRCE